MKNPFDSIVAYVNPMAGARRVQARNVLRVLNSGYSEGGASKRKHSMKGWFSKGGGTKEDIENNLSVLRERSRDLYMNSPIARAAINRIQTNVVGQGLTCHFSPMEDVLGLTRQDSKQWARSTEREFKLWAESNACDHIGLNNFYELQQIALLSWLQSGDAFVLLPMESTPGMPYDLRVHLIEADRVCNPPSIPKGVTIREGVEISPSGRVVAYWIKNSHPLSQGSGNAEDSKWVRVPVRGASGRRNILHMMVAERPEQYRGVPLLAPIIESCKQLSRYSEVELQGAVVASMYTVFITSDTPDTPLGEIGDNSAEGRETESVNEPRLGSGAIVSLNPGETVVTSAPGRPNSQFDAFINAVAREVGAAIDVPSELLLLSFTKSYSASRAALLEAWKCFRKWRKWMTWDMCDPIKEEWLIEAILLGRVKAPGFFNDPMIQAAWCNAEWHGPAPGQINPVDEVKAAQMRVENGFSTRTQETAEITGGDFSENIAEREAEEKLMREAGLVPETGAAQQV